MKTATLTVLALLLASGTGSAQVFELGGGISRGCIGDSSGFCGDRTGPMPSAHGSLWLGDRLEIGLRVASLKLPDLAYSIFRDDRFNAVDDPVLRQLPRIDAATEYHSRRLLGGEAIYHFLRGLPVRPMLGIGIGTRTERFFQTCLPSGCERLMPILSSPVGQFSDTRSNVTAIAGLSGRIHERLQLRGGVRLHNFAGEEASTTEVFVAAGYRFGR